MNQRYLSFLLGALIALAVPEAADAQRPVRQSTSRDVRICGVVSVTDGFTPVTTLTLSGADEAEALREGTATLDISGATWAAVTGADGCYTLTLSTTATDTVGELIVSINDDTLVLPIWERFQVFEEAVYDRDYAASATGDSARVTLALPAAAPDAAGGLPISDTGGLDLDARLDAAISSRMATFTLPSNFSSMDINGTGGVGIDWGNVQNPTTTVGLSGTTVDLVAGAVDDAALNSTSELTGHATSALNSYDPPTRAEATADKAEIEQMIGVRSTVSALSSQTAFTPTAAPTSDAQLPGWGVLLIDAGDPDAYSLRKIVSVSSGEITINKAPDFTLATTDVVVFLPAFTNEPVETAFVYCEVNTANFAGSSTTLACILTDKDGAAVTAATGDLTGLELRVTSGAQIYEGRFINSTTWDAGNSELQLTLSRALPATLADGVTAIIR